MLCVDLLRTFLRNCFEGVGFRKEAVHLQNARCFSVFQEPFFDDSLSFVLRVIPFKGKRSVWALFFFWGVFVSVQRENQRCSGSRSL